MGSAGAHSNSVSLVRCRKRVATASGNLHRRHQKAIHRKRLLAQRHRLEAAGAIGTLAGNVRRAAAAPLHSCFVQDRLFESGVGMVILTRKTGEDRFAIAGFLVDVYCLGVKDVLFRETDETEMKMFLGTVEASAPLASIDPPYARKLLRDAVAYAQSRIGASRRLRGSGAAVRRRRPRRL